MQKDRWLDFLAHRIRSQVAVENFQKAQTWLFALLAAVSFGFAVNGISNASGSSFIYVTKVLFLECWHLLLLFGVFLPFYLQKGDKSLARALGIRDFTSLIVTALCLTFYSYVVFSLSRQVVKDLENIQVSGLFTFSAWTNFILAIFYFAGLVFYFASLWLFPGAITKLAEKGRPLLRFFVALHVGVFLLWGWGYGDLVTIGSPPFFEQARMAGLFWIAMGALLFFLGNILRGSPLATLNALELEVASGRLERHEDILARFKEAFILKRLGFWVNRISHDLGTQSHEIAKNLHEAVSMISEPKPSETQLAQVEDRYKKASAVYKKLEKQNQRFLLNISFFNLLDIEREKVEELRDQFSRELRHAKLELASVRKRIDDRLVALKDGEKQEIAEAAREPVPASSSRKS